MLGVPGTCVLEHKCYWLSSVKKRSKPGACEGGGDDKRKYFLELIFLQ